MELESALINKKWEEVRNLLDPHIEFLKQNVSKTHDLLLDAVYHGAPLDIIIQLIFILPHFINRQNEGGDTVLHVAVRYKRWELVPVLLQHGADINIFNDFDYIPLHEAATLGAPADVITRLIDSHNINIGDPFTALRNAAKSKRWELVPVLLQHGADINLCNDFNETPLHYAAYESAPADIITQLISPYNINKPESCTPLHRAVSRCARVPGSVEGMLLPWSTERREAVSVLLQHGADVNLGYQYENQTPLQMAAWHAPADIITRLISPHNINRQDKKGETALHEAVRGKRWEIVPVLLQYGADPCMLDSAQPDQPLVRSLKALCIATIRSHMPVKSDEAYERLGLPCKLVAEVKLRPQAEDIVERGHCVWKS